MVSTGMKPSLSSSGSAAIDVGRQVIPRPPPVEFRRLLSGPQENIIHAMEISHSAFESFKKLLRDQAVMLLDCDRFLYEQSPEIWAVYLDWAREELAPMLSKYADTWPVELYVEHYLAKKTYSKRHAFRTKMTKLRPAPKPVRVKSSASERGASLLPASASPPPAYEEHDFVDQGTAGGDDLGIENFLKTVNPDLRHLLLAFEELGISNEADLAVVRSWPPAVRKDFFERELMGRMSPLQIQALNVRLAEMQ
ncbi:uncharacterized protein EDB91DRAFT_474335 [Suillus paluster]|uniref:uncharacterized protein n=1 Tax=Suillus paluster TaxID=48578 RepID=UPI001B87D66D|nr:uncharacterized protein EDB91DRAFT_474335 [Suillus paluster]KAG1737904.1 hypothetical protein EDB91DRAFT_474335 [Suillus paluster]